MKFGELIVTHSIATFGLLGQGLSNSQEAQETKSSQTTHTPDSVSLGVVDLLIEKDKGRSGHKSCVGSKGHTETTSGGIKGLVHVATRRLPKAGRTAQLAK